MTPTPDGPRTAPPRAVAPAPVHVAVDEHGVGAAVARARALTSLISRSGAFAVLILLVIIGAIFDKGFIHPDNLRNIALGASFIGIITAGMTFVIISGGIDLSVGSVFALGVLTSAFMSRHGSFLAIVVPLLCCGAAGLVQGTIIARLGLPPFIVTLAGLTGIRGLVYYITKEGNLTPRVPAHTTFLTMGQGKLFTVGWPVWITLAVFAVGWWLLNRTAFGQAVQTIGGNNTAAELMGLPVKRVKTMASRPFSLPHCPGVARRLGSAIRMSSLRSPPSSSAAPFSAAVSGRWRVLSPASPCGSSSPTWWSKDFSSMPRTSKS
jgi:galactofuranose transport system permease protein